MNYLSALETALGYQFRDKSLLSRALQHSSLHQTQSNERLEFLGDRVLGLVLADVLYRAEPEIKEGEMARYLNQMVCKSTCVSVAKDIALGRAMVLSRGEKHTGGHQKETILADACEAIIAAVFLDSNWETIRDIVLRLWTPYLNQLSQETSVDSKTRLQEWSQAKGLGLPLYEIIGREGADHEPLFTVQLTVGKFPPVQAQGTTKRIGERGAAVHFLKKYASL